MKIQELAIIFVIIILPISLLLSEYTQFQIQTINTQTSYDTQLTSATYDAIKAFQLNAKNETYSDIANLRVENIEASVNAFRNSIKSAFQLNGATEEEINNYIPALVYTLYDGFYIYSPYENTNYRYIDEETGESITKTDATSSDTKADDNGEQLYGLKPYISYSCRYKTSSIDVVITYSLDNCITVQGMINSNYVNRTGYLIDGIYVHEDDDTVTYNEVTIETEQLTEKVAGKDYKYIKKNGVKYYLDEDNDKIIYISNGTIKKQLSSGEEGYEEFKNMILYNDSAIQYYKEAYDFTNWFKQSGLDTLKYGDAYDEMIDNSGNIILNQVWKDDTTVIFDFNSGGNASDNIENELSNFNQHRLAVIRHKIETNLTIAISNYNEYSGASNVFQMPELKEDEWEHITHNICLISFLQGLHIGGKTYNGYSLVTNSESEEVVLEDNIYILGEKVSDGTKAYHRIGDKGFEDGSVNVDSGLYGETKSAGRINLDFERVAVTNSDGTASYYYYPLKEYNASYDSIVMQNNVTNYDDIYEYVNGQSDDLKIAFYTALGRERAGKYNSNINYNLGETTQTTTPTEPDSGTTTPAIYAVTLNANGGTFGNGAEELQYNVSHGMTTTLPSGLTRDGYTFLGWSTSSTALIATYSSSAAITVTKDITLYAVWKQNTSTITNPVTITFNLNGGTGTFSSITVESGTTVTLPTTKPTKSGYIFTVWSRTIQNLPEPETYMAGEEITANTDMTLTATWMTGSNV